jgi:hypothetical protein
MIPRVDLSELILEVMSWHPDLVAAFTSVTGGRARLADLYVSVAALLTAHALNVGLSPVVDEQIAALTRGRLVHIDQHYLRAETYAAANAVLIDAQAGIAIPTRATPMSRADRHGCGGCPLTTAGPGSPAAATVGCGARLSTDTRHEPIL